MAHVFIYGTCLQLFEIGVHLFILGSVLREVTTNFFLVRDLDKFSIIWQFYFRLEPIFATGSKNIVPSKLTYV